MPSKKYKLRKVIVKMCSYSGCDECEFFEPEDDTDGEYFCDIRDKDNKIPYHNGWDMESALNIKAV